MRQEKALEKIEKLIKQLNTLKSNIKVHVAKPRDEEKILECVNEIKRPTMMISVVEKAGCTQARIVDVLTKHKYPFLTCDSSGSKKFRVVMPLKFKKKVREIKHRKASDKYHKFVKRELNTQFKNGLKPREAMTRVNKLWKQNKE